VVPIVVPLPGAGQAVQEARGLVPGDRPVLPEVEVFRLIPIPRIGAQEGAAADSGGGNWIKGDRVIVRVVRGGVEESEDLRLPAGSRAPGQKQQQSRRQNQYPFHPVPPYPTSQIAS